MGLIINTNRLWLLLLVILGSATVTDRFVQPGNILTGQTSQDRSRHIVSAADTAAYRLYRPPDINLVFLN